MKTRAFVSTALCLLVAAAASPALAIDPAAAAVRAHAEFLADDLLQGRDTGSPGHEIAARYAATRFEQWGLDPGAGGTYLQRIQFQTTTLDEATLSVETDDGTKPLEYKTDYLLGPRGAHPDFDLTAPVVFVGFGVEAPEFGQDDYAKVDVKGKIVVVLSGAPAAYPSEQRAHHASSRHKAEVASAHGAVGMIRLRDRREQKEFNWERISQFAGRPEFNWKHPDGKVEDPGSELRFSLTLHPDRLEELLVASGTTTEALLESCDENACAIQEFPFRLHVTGKSSIETLSSPNVVAILRGSDARLRDEYVVVTAHLDHVGVGREVDGDNIRNGFYDNALGSSIVLEAAREIAAGPRPSRSIAFVLVTGEEKGLQGSDFFSQHPSVPKSEVVADVNIDMPLLLRPLADLVPLGAEHSSLGPLAEAVAHLHGFEMSPDPAPEQNYFVRSDQYSFVRQGIPAINLTAGTKTRGGGDDQAKAAEAFRKNNYHRPSDESSLGADWDTVARYTATQVDLIRTIANVADRPRWNDGDFFGDTFGHQAH